MKGLTAIDRIPVNEVMARSHLPNMRPLRRRGAVLALLALCIALGGAGLACGQPSYGIVIVETDTGGNLIAKAHSGLSGEFRLHRSNDGGFTWQHVGESPYENFHLRDDPPVATTPRGTYQVIRPEDTGNVYEPSNLNTRIVRTLDGQSETVFSMAQLLDKANITLQQNASGPETEMYDIHYDLNSGNVIAAMGTEGVLVGTPDGRWLRAGVGFNSPTDFSAAARTRLLISALLFWASALAVSIFATATAVVFAVVRGRDIGGAIILAGGVVVVAYAFYLARDLNPLGAIMQLVLITAVLAIIAIALLFILEAAGYRRESLALAVVGLVLAGAMFVFPGFPGFSVLALLSYPPILLIVALPTLLLVAVAIFPYHPKGREWLDVSVSAAFMTVVSVVPVVLWLQYIIGYETAKWVSIGLVAVIAIGLFIRLKRRRRISVGSLPSVGR